MIQKVKKQSGNLGCRSVWGGGGWRASGGLVGCFGLGGGQGLGSGVIRCTAKE
jgi:hypothetical protein